MTRRARAPPARRSPSDARGRRARGAARHRRPAASDRSLATRAGVANRSRRRSVATTASADTREVMKSRSCDGVRGAPRIGGAVVAVVTLTSRRASPSSRPTADAGGCDCPTTSGTHSVMRRWTLESNSIRTRDRRSCPSVGFRRETLERLALGTRMWAIDVSHARYPFSSGGLRPPDPLTRSLASRFAGSLRSRGSLRSARSRHARARMRAKISSLVRRSSHDDCKARASAAPSSDGAGVSAR